MPPKKKGKPLSKKDKNDKSNNNNNDNSTEWDNLDNLSIEQAITMLSNDHQKFLQERIHVQKEFESMYQSFYESMKQSVSKMEMKIKAKEMEIEGVLNDQSAEIQVYNEKQQFIQYDHEQNLKSVDEDRMELIKDELKRKESKLSQNEASQIALKMEIKERGIVFMEEVQNTKERFKQESEEAQKKFNLQLNTLQQDCLIGHESTQDSLKIKAKDEINKMIELNRKHLEELNQRQEETYKDTEKYFTTVSKQNTANIQRLLEECDRTDQLICDYDSQSLSLEEENERLSEPLSKYLRTVDTMKVQTKGKEKDRHTSISMKSRTVIIEDRVKAKLNQTVKLQAKYNELKDELERIQKAYEVDMNEDRNCDSTFTEYNHFSDSIRQLSQGIDECLHNYQRSNIIVNENCCQGTATNRKSKSNKPKQRTETNEKFNNVDNDIVGCIDALTKTFLDITNKLIF